MSRIVDGVERREHGRVDDSEAHEDSRTPLTAATASSVVTSEPWAAAHLQEYGVRMILDELLELEHRGWRSLCDSTGSEFYGGLMTADGVMVLGHGQIFDRQDVIESLSHAPPWRTYKIDHERLIPLGEDAAALVYRGTAYREGADPAFVGLMTSVYVRQAEGWALASYQQTPIPG